MHQKNEFSRLNSDATPARALNWTCPSCAADNDHGRASCRRCGGPPPPPPSSRDTSAPTRGVRLAVHRLEPERQVGGIGQREVGPPPPPPSGRERGELAGGSRPQARPGQDRTGCSGDDLRSDRARYRSGRPGTPERHRPEASVRCCSPQGPVSAFGSFGRPRTSSPMMLRWICDVPA